MLISRQTDEGRNKRGRELRYGAENSENFNLELLERFAQPHTSATAIATAVATAQEAINTQT